MNDRAISLLEQYDLEILRTRKGRGTIICDTEKGTIWMKEYTGHPEKLNVLQQVLGQVHAAGMVRTEALLAGKDGQLFVKDNDGTCYIVMTCFEGCECNIYDSRECMEAMRLLAKLHMSMECEGMLPENAGSVFFPLREYEKRNRELLRVRSYLKKKGQKQVFERCLQGAMESFVQQAGEVTESWRTVEESGLTGSILYCHGDYQYHNILRTQEGWRIVNFEKMQADNPVRDICLFMRKVMEKNNWSLSLGRDMLAAYEVIRRLDTYDRLDLYHRFAYPEKFWKIVNFYYNSPKAWIPEKNMEKLEKVLRQEKEKQTFLQEILLTNKGR